MKNNIKRFLSITIVLLIGFTTVSCDETEDLDIGTTSLQDASGDWYVQFLVDGVDVYGLGYQLITTTNTASNTGNEFWIDDRTHTWWFKVKCPIQASSLTFSGADLESSVDGYDITVQITNGAIVKDGATTSGGNTADSIYFEAEFSDDPGTIYQLTGYKRTGLAEDEH